MACSFKGCGRPVFARGYCNTHYQQARRTGTVTAIRERTSEPSMMLGGVRVSRRAFDLLSAAGPTPYVAARSVIEKWAKRKEARS